MKKHTISGTILSAALITMGGVALAQQSGAGTGTGAGQMPNQAAPMTPGAGDTGTTGAPGTTTQSPGSDMTAPSMGQADSPLTSPPETVVGKSIVNADGDEIGEVSKIVGDQVIVEVGGFLGIGARDVAVSWSQIQPTGMGDDMELRTTLTKEELEAMPEYTE